MSRSALGRAAGLLSDFRLSLSRNGPAIGRVLDREYMAAWHTFFEFAPSSVKTLIDIGAHDGMYAERASKYFALQRTILIEPLPDKTERLQQLGLPGLTVIASALADRVGNTTFTINETAQASSIKKVNPELGQHYGVDLSEVASINVNVTTLDRVFEELQLSNIDLVKIDVQGAERELLRGAQKSLPHIRFIQIEALFAEHYADAADFCELYGTLSSSGFKLARLTDFANSPSGILLQCDAVFQNERLVQRD
jgi:FkbM family methyltransferase